MGAFFCVGKEVSMQHEGNDVYILLPMVERSCNVCTWLSKAANDAFGQDERTLGELIRQQLTVHLIQYH